MKWNNKKIGLTFLLIGVVSLCACSENKDGEIEEAETSVETEISNETDSDVISEPLSDSEEIYGKTDFSETMDSSYDLKTTDQAGELCVEITDQCFHGKGCR